MAKQGSDEQWNGKEKLGKAMAMDARCSFDKQWQSMEQKRVATAKRSGEWQRIEESRFAMELTCNGVAQNRSAWICSGMASACLAMAKK